MTTVKNEIPSELFERFDKLMQSSETDQALIFQEMTKIIAWISHHSNAFDRASAHKRITQLLNKVADIQTTYNGRSVLALTTLSSVLSVISGGIGLSVFFFAPHAAVIGTLSQSFGTLSQVPDRIGSTIEKGKESLRHRYTMEKSTIEQLQQDEHSAHQRKRGQLETIMRLYSEMNSTLHHAHKGVMGG